jgi:hypothetical protein
MTFSILFYPRSVLCDKEVIFFTFLTLRWGVTALPGSCIYGASTFLAYRYVTNYLAYAQCKLSITTIFLISANDAEHTLKLIKLTLSIR